MLKAYLAGPDVFLPNAAEHARRKVEICRAHGIHGRPPLDEDILGLMQQPSDIAWRGIYAKDIEMMRECDIIIANLTPFAGASADSGTLIEVGWFLGQGKPIYGYSNSAQPFDARMKDLLKVLPFPIENIVIEGFGLPDNLMIPGAVLEGGGCAMVTPTDGKDRAFDALDMFEKCVALAARSSEVTEQIRKNA